MSTWKVCLLLCVMLLLPVRDAMAGMGSLCEHAPQRAQVVAQHAMQIHGEHAVQHAVESTDELGQFSHHPHDDRSAAGSCNLCVSLCSSPPLATAAVPFPTPSTSDDVVFPPVDLTRLSYLTGALDRPPRSI